jgi:hypothetical protein
MNVFSVNPLRIKELRKPFIIKMIMVFGSVIFIAFVLPAVLSDQPFSIGNGSSLIVFIIFVLFFFFSIYNGLKKQEKMLSSYKLIITDDSFIREMLAMPNLVILKKDVTQIVKNTNGRFGIIGNSKINAIGIPSQIENQVELEYLLSEVKPITVQTSTRFNNLIWPGMLLGMALLFASFYSNSKIVEVISILCFSVFSIYFFIIASKSNNIDKRTKRLRYVMLFPFILMIVSLIYRLLA